jgi:transcriptional regulator with XRE-family HTH domain
MWMPHQRGGIVHLQHRRVISDDTQVLLSIPRRRPYPPPSTPRSRTMNQLPGDLFARRLRQERERLSISQAELARRIAGVLGSNVDPSAVTRIEQQIRAVRLDEAVAAAEALGVPLITLLTDDPVAENEAQLQQALVDLDIARHQWERSRIEVQRLSRLVQLLSGGTAGPVDTRLPAEGEDPGPQSRVTAPDA